MLLYFKADYNLTGQMGTLEEEGSATDYSLIRLPGIRLQVMNWSALTLGTVYVTVTSRSRTIVCHPESVHCAP